MDWTEKYRPTTLAEVRGNDSAREDLREWAESWDDHREAAVVHGSPGVGKTSAVHALAADMGWETTEMNASDDRTADVVDRIAGEASKTASLDADWGSTGAGAGGGDAGTGEGSGDPPRRLVVLDEADNLHGSADRGGTRAITRVVKEARQPVVLIANDFYDMSRGLRNACREIEFRDVSARSIVPALRDICRKEGIEFEEAALQAIAERTSGDLRSAINDLQAVAEGRDRVTEDDVVTGERDRSTDLFGFMDVLFKEGTAREALETSYDVDETPDDLIQWIEDNVPREYEGATLARAYDRLAAADRWLGRVRATQNYTYWRYAGDNMTAGVAAARDGTRGGWTRWGSPSFWSKLGRSRSTREKRDEIARRIGERSGTSVGTARRQILPYLSTMTHLCRDRDLTVRVAARYDLDAAEVSFVTGSGESTNKVESIVEDARERREAASVEGTGEAFAPRPDDEGSDEDAADAETAGGDAEDADGSESTDGTTGGLDAFAEDGDDADTADGADADPDATDPDATESSDGDGDDATDPDDRADAAEEDDQQSGLGEFM